MLGIPYNFTTFKKFIRATYDKPEGFISCYLNDIRHELSIVIIREIWEIYIESKDKMLRKKGAYTVYKSAAFLTYWVSHLKPILITDQSEKYINKYFSDKFKYKYINEWFGVGMAWAFLKRIMGTLPKLSKEFVENLIFDLRYKTITVNDIASRYETFIMGIKCPPFNYPSDSDGNPLFT